MSGQMSMFPDHQFNDVERLKEFMLAGSAKITVRSEKTMVHYTFKIRKDKDSGIWYVSKLSGNQNYIYLGTIFENQQFQQTKKSANNVKTIHDWFKAFEWFWRNVSTGVFPPNTTVYHEGRCGMCGLELTDPVSIKEGYGPDCLKKRLRRPMMNDRKSA